MVQTFVSTAQLVEFEVNPESSDLELNVIKSDLGTVVNGIGFRSEDNFIYAVHPIDHQLLRLDANGEIEILADLDLVDDHFYLGAAISPSGRYLILVGSDDIDGDIIDTEFAYVDLEDDDYGVDIVTLSGELVYMLDIAFDPIDDQLFGFDSRGNRLVKIESDGEVVAPFEPTDVLENAGALFFNSSGELFVYGSTTGGVQTSFAAVDKNTGEVTIQATGPPVRATDGCTCPIQVSTENADALDFALYPNPASNYLFIDSQKSIIEVTVTDVYGRQMDAQYDQVGIDLSTMPTGTYFVLFKFLDGNVASSSVVVSR